VKNEIVYCFLAFLAITANCGNSTETDKSPEANGGTATASGGGVGGTGDAVSSSGGETTSTTQTEFADTGGTQGTADADGVGGVDAAVGGVEATPGGDAAGGSGGASGPDTAAPEGAVWARTVTNGTVGSSFYSASFDSSGNIYAVGIVQGTDTYDFGNGVSVTGTADFGNVILVKYDGSGAAQWSRTLTSGPSYSRYNSVALDSFGNIYAAGRIDRGTYGFGNDVTATGRADNASSLLVKYSPTGTAVWAQSLNSNSENGQFQGVAVDGVGNVYAVGTVDNSGSYSFGNGVWVTGTNTASNPVLVKYNSSGQAQWAKTITSGSGGAAFSAAAVDRAGNVYVVGFIAFQGTTYGFGNGISVAGDTGANANTNVLAVKYDSSGQAQWARTMDLGSAAAEFYSVAVDPSGNCYVAGSQGSSAVLAKYDPSGTVLWVTPAPTGSGNSAYYSLAVSAYYSLAVDSSANLWVGGKFTGTGTLDFGNGVNAKGVSTTNTLLVMYNSSGLAQRAQALSSGSGTAEFLSVAVGPSDSVIAAGYIDGTASYGLGEGATVQGTSPAENALLVKF
jgi:hypothetical protein